ncbi:MAG: Na/Pi cotransporter family protein [Bacilli bacterium]
MNAVPVLQTLGLIGAGMAVFVTGLLTMRYGLTQAASSYTERRIKTFVRTPARGLLTGVAATLVTQSSTAVTLISMGLVAADILSFTDTIGIILGTNIGSTLTVGLLSLNVERIGPYLILAGLIAYLGALSLRRTAPRRRQIGQFAISVIGFGTLFVGFHVMTAAAAPLAASPGVTQALLVARVHPFAGVLTGAVVTAVIGSSSASTALALSLAKTGALPLVTAIAVVLGNNIGACTTALLASIGGNRSVQRVAATHVLLNVCGVALFMLILRPFAAVVSVLVRDPGGQVALAHVLFNVISSLLALPFVYRIAAWLEIILPERA